MNKILSLVICALILLLPVSALAEPDLSGMSFEELVALRQEIDLLLFGSDEYKEVSVPQGTYTVGTDIPAGTYSLSSELSMMQITTDDSGSIESMVAVYSITSDSPVAKAELGDGYIVTISGKNVTFTTYTGLGF